MAAKKISSATTPKKPKAPKKVILRHALFDVSLTYRWLLQRSWAQEDEKLHLQLWVLLNPSTGDGQKDDATIIRCMSYAEREGYNGIQIINLFGFISSEPDALLTTLNPVGADNHMYVEEALRQTMGDVVVGWGSWWNEHRSKSDAIPRPHIESTIKAAGRKMVCLGKNNDGSPKHPLYLKADLPFVPFAELA